MRQYKVFSPLALSSVIILFLASSIPAPVMAGEDIFRPGLAFYHDKGGSSGSPYGDILKSIEKGKEQKKQEPETSQPTPVEPQMSPPPKSTGSSPGVPLSPQPPPPNLQTPKAPFMATPQPPGKTYKNLPPVLKRLNDLAEKVYYKMDRVRECNEINRTTRQILQVLLQIYSGEIKTKIPDGFILGFIVFCKETTVKINETGYEKSSERHNVRYQVKGKSKASWSAAYYVDVSKRKGHLFEFRIETEDPKFSAKRTEVTNLSGRLLVLRHGALPAVLPVDGYNVKSGLSLVLVPTKFTKWIRTPAKWPDNLPLKYSLSMGLPVFAYYSTQEKKQALPPGCPVVHYASDALSPTDLSKFVEKGQLTIKLGKGQIVGEVWTKLPDQPLEEPDDKNKSFKEKIVGEVWVKEPGESFDDMELAGVHAGKNIVLTTETNPICLDFKVDLEVDLPPLGCTTDKNSPRGAVAVSGDCIDHGGFILATERHVHVNNKPVARVGDKVFCLIHGITEIAGDKSVNVYSGKKRIAKVGDKTKCGATIMGGSADTYAGRGKP